MEAEDPPTSSLPSPKSQKASSPLPTARLPYTKEIESRTEEGPAILWDMTPSASVRTSPAPPSVSGSETARRSRSPAPPISNTATPYRCKYPQCAGKTFPRACEWNKHIQRHERPFYCSHPSCNIPGKEMRGFTYAGGLVRHEKEVHGQHGGVREIWHCPYNACKRYSGEGFKRHDNLREHVKRMHRSGGQVDSGNDEGRVFKDEYKEENESEEGELQDHRSSGTMRNQLMPSRAIPDPITSRKRKWSSGSLASEYTVAKSYRAELTPTTATPQKTTTISSHTPETDLMIKRLRLIIWEKDAENARLKQAVFNLQDAIHSLTTPAGSRPGRV